MAGVYRARQEIPVDDDPLRRSKVGGSSNGQHSKGPTEEGTPEHRLSGRNLHDFLDIEIDPLTNLAGDRWLTRTSGAFVIAPSGHGKSSMSNQMAISFAIGRRVFGINPARPLRVLIIQSEDDDAETKKFVQMIRKMGLSEKELALLKQNTRVEYRNDLTGPIFIQALDAFLTEWPADVVIINPISGFFLEDLKETAKVNHFLRADLNRVLTKHQCAAILIHHTPKTNFARLDEMQWYDWMYVMAGCATLTNWARAVLVIAPSKVPGTYRFIAAKRFDEIQWTNREYWFSHSRETVKVKGKDVTVISWVPSSEDQILCAKPAAKGKRDGNNVTSDAVWQKMSPIEEYTRETFQDWAGKEFNIGVNKAKGILWALRDTGRVETREEKRPRTNPLVWYRKATKEGV